MDYFSTHLYIVNISLQIEVRLDQKHFFIALSHTPFIFREHPPLISSLSSLDLSYIMRLQPSKLLDFRSSMVSINIASAPLYRQVHG